MFKVDPDAWIITQAINVTHVYPDGCWKFIPNSKAIVSIEQSEPLILDYGQIIYANEDLEMGPALRALSIVTGVRVTELERWFEHTDHPDGYVWLEPEGALSLCGRTKHNMLGTGKDV